MSSSHHRFPLPLKIGEAPSRTQSPYIDVRAAGISRETVCSPSATPSINVVEPSIEPDKPSSVTPVSVLSLDRRLSTTSIASDGHTDRRSSTSSFDIFEHRNQSDVHEGFNATQAVLDMAVEPKGKETLLFSANSDCIKKSSANDEKDVRAHEASDSDEVA